MTSGAGGIVIGVVLAVVLLAGCSVVTTPTVVPDPTPADMQKAQAPPAVAGGAIESYGPDPANQIMYALPVDPSAQAMIIFIHGGGWTSGDKMQWPQEITRETARGYVVASIDYRLAPAHPFPAPLTDVKRAVRWAKANADRLGIRPERVLLVGNSAGAHLALLTAQTVGSYEPTDLSPDEELVDSQPAGVVAGSAPTDLARLMTDPNGQPRPWAREAVGNLLGCQNEAGVHDGSVCDPGLLNGASPIYRAAPGQPPVYLVTGGKDDLCPPSEQGLPFATAYAKEAGNTWYDPAENADHNALPAANPTALDAFLDRASGVIATPPETAPPASTSTSTTDPAPASSSTTYVG